ncbi:adenosine-specific kinase [Candidatus Bathyarchaeota archaeon]|nr:adenosine-specific kinase [Candidatus Bathyarchaeota archaeon]
MDIKTVRIETVSNCNIILGMAHFIKTAEDLYEALVNSAPDIKFGVGFCESSGPCLVRSEGNDEQLKAQAAKAAFELSCGHSFVIYIKNAFPINVLGRIKEVTEVCTIHAATANPLQVIICETKQGRGILGVIDGSRSRGIEKENDAKARKEFLRKIGYKL